MIPDYASLIPSDFSEDSRIWIFQASRSLNADETSRIRSKIQAWVNQWKAHAEPVKGWGDILFHRFLLFMADESVVPVSGCSTDGLMRFVQILGNNLQIDWFDRMQIALLHHEEIITYPLDTIELLWSEKKLSPTTWYFNNTVRTKHELLSSWILPIQKGWLGARLSLSLAE
ncbi:MAG: hypothetical protein K6T34_10045 [Thermoflavifilum sp.]|nr:hypothetical protein [Thermoflavifilum sp.]